MTELLVGTKKGLFVLRGERGTAFTVAGRAFPGDVVEYAVRDPRTGRTFASVTSGFYGPRVMFTDGDPLGDWQQATGPAFPEGGDTTVERIWRIEPGEADGLLYAGVAPASLFVSTDGGETWTLNESLWKEREAGEWNPGAGGLALHSICPWPGDPQRLAVGVSARGCVAHRRRRRNLAHRLSRPRAPLHAGRGTREHERALRAQHGPVPSTAGTAVPAVPRKRVSQRRRGRDVERHRRWLAERLRVPDRDRSRTIPTARS